MVFRGQPSQYELLMWFNGTNHRENVIFWQLRTVEYCDWHSMHNVTCSKSGAVGTAAIVVHIQRCVYRVFLYFSECDCAISTLSVVDITTLEMGRLYLHIDTPNWCSFAHTYTQWFDKRSRFLIQQINLSSFPRIPNQFTCLQWQKATPEPHHRHTLLLRNVLFVRHATRILHIPSETSIHSMLLAFSYTFLQQTHQKFESLIRCIKFAHRP